MGLVFSISNFFINKIYQAKYWSEKKIPYCANSALVCQSKGKWRFRKMLWPSQNIWTLLGGFMRYLHSSNYFVRSYWKHLRKKVFKCDLRINLAKLSGVSQCQWFFFPHLETEGLKAFLSLSFPRVILGNFGKKPFPEFLKAFLDLERDWQNLSCYF